MELKLHSQFIPDDAERLNRTFMELKRQELLTAFEACLS